MEPNKKLLTEVSNDSFHDVLAYLSDHKIEGVDGFMDISKTNISALIDAMTLNSIFVLAPVMHKDSQTNLEKEFPTQVAELFDYFTLATDDYRDNTGEVLPGIGGSVYKRLGFSGQAGKNAYIPDIIKDRIFSC